MSHRVCIECGFLKPEHEFFVRNGWIVCGYCLVSGIEAEERERRKTFYRELDHDFIAAVIVVAVVSSACFLALYHGMV